MSQLSTQLVKGGYWINWEKGRVMGATITTSAQTGNVVVAVLAVLTAFGMGHLWNLTSFTYYQFRVNSSPKDGLFMQQQALLRTLPTPSTLVAEWLKLWWAWRTKSNKAFTRSILQVALGFIFAVAISVVGIFSSYLVDGTDIQILVHNPVCKPLNATQLLLSDFRTGGDYVSYVTDLGYSYAKDCYETTQLPERCKVFVKSTTPIQQERVECPFGGTLCKNISLPAIALDSGLVEIAHFGANMPPNNGVKYRKRTTCAVLELKDYQTIVNAPDYPGFRESYAREPFPEERVLLANLGTPYGGTNMNETMAFSLLRQELSEIYTMRSTPQWASPAWQAEGALEHLLPEMENNLTDLNLALAVLGGQLLFGSPIDDIMFSGHKTLSNTYFGTTSTLYKHDNPLAAVGCQLQYQFCISHDSGGEYCSELAGLPSGAEEVLSTHYPQASSVQLAVLDILISTSALFNTARGLLDHFHMGETGIKTMDGVPKDYWVQEMVYWEQYVWSMIQIGYADYAIGVTSRFPRSAEAILNNTTSGQAKLCGMQKMRSPGGFVNINVFGLSFLIAVCCLVSALDLIILKFLIFLKRFRKTLSPRIEQWIQDGIFQIQRRAFEAHGAGTWERLDEVVPVTVTSTELAWGPGVCKCEPELIASSSGLTTPTATNKPAPIVHSSEVEHTGGSLQEDDSHQERHSQSEDVEVVEFRCMAESPDSCVEATV